MNGGRPYETEGPDFALFFSPQREKEGQFPSSISPRNGITVIVSIEGRIFDKDSIKTHARTPRPFESNFKYPDIGKKFDDFQSENYADGGNLNEASHAYAAYPTMARFDIELTILRISLEDSKSTSMKRRSEEGGE